MAGETISHWAVVQENDGFPHDSPLGTLAWVQGQLLFTTPDLMAEGCLIHINSETLELVWHTTHIWPELRPPPPRCGSRYVHGVYWGGVSNASGRDKGRDIFFSPLRTALN